MTTSISEAVVSGNLDFSIRDSISYPNAAVTPAALFFSSLPIR